MTNQKNNTANAIVYALERMLTEGKKVNVSAVARRAGTTHTNIWKHYPDLYKKITATKNEQKKANEKSNQALIIERLKRKISRLEEKIEKSDVIKETNIDAIVMAKLTEIYRDYDSQLRKNIDLASIDLHRKYNIDTDTGEVIDGTFGNDNEN
ncbi:hypothetical protein [Vibrio coralliirubri]|uniref:hypothetical protein n=1 Tax=Vibrio coralliirubri TaxID=1516159 RepID=UPI00067F1C4B|nr:hypothetical protein [Vibrio coralliirubri]